MKAVFADTPFYVSLANTHDVNHAIALSLAETIDGPTITTEYVLVELGNWLSRAGDRLAFLTLMDQISVDQDVTVLGGSGDLFARGVHLFRQRPDKDWYLTDCISFVVMQEQQLTEALTADHHFEQAGFTILLK